MVLAHSYENSAAYRDLCAAAGVEPADVRSLDDIRRLPLIDKTTLRDHYPDQLRTCGLDNIIEVHSTSGTTGKPTPIWASRHDMDLWFERNARTMWMIGLRPGDLLQNMFGYGLPTSIGLQYGAQHAGIGVVPAGIGRQELLIDLIVDLGVTAHLHDAVLRPVPGREGARARHRPQPETPSFASACSAPSRGRSPAASGSPPPWASTSSTSTAWASSSGPAWLPSARSSRACTCGRTTCYVECIDPVTLEPVADGAPGELVWTSLTSDSTAMIRYRSHDISSLTYEPCACGRSHPRIGRITGRSDDAVSVGGLVVFPSQIEEVLVTIDEFGSNFCMVIENVNNLDRLTLQVEVCGLDEMSAEAQARLSKAIVTGVKTTVGVSPKIELHAPYALPRDTAGQGKTACHRVDDRRVC